MADNIPNQWYGEPPQMLVSADGVYGCALAEVLGAAELTSEMLKRGPEPLQDGSFPSVLDSVRRVLLCVEDRTSTAEVIWQHDRAWHWLESLTEAAEYHEVGFIFIVGEQNAQPVEALLRAELGLVSRRDSKSIALWRKTESLASLLRAIESLGKRDLQTLRTLRASQPKRRALILMKAAILGGTAEQMYDCAKSVADAFQRDQLAFDTFCVPPCHQNGNAWRRWISRVVTGGVTPDLGTEGTRLATNLNL